MVAIGRHEHLRFVAQAAKADRVDDAIAVSLKRVAGAADAAVILVMTPPAAGRRV
jgi:hypothetical protein